MKVKIEIDGSNAAFFDEDGKLTGEFGRILRCAARLIDEGVFTRDDFNRNLRDINGNVCGFIEISEG